MSIWAVFCTWRIDYDDILKTLAGLHLVGKFEVNFGMTTREAFSVVWNVVTNSLFSVGSSNTKENLQRISWSQELPDDSAELHIKIQLVPRSKHTPSRLYIQSVHVL